MKMKANYKTSDASGQTSYTTNKFTRGFLVWLADFASVVLIVLCNKALMSPPVNFRFPVTLTAAHFACTAIVSSLLMRSKGTESMPYEAQASSQTFPPWYVTATFVLVSGAAIITVNASLLLNSVAFYQIMKMLTLPIVATVEALSGTKRYGLKHVVAFAVILLGVGLTITGDMESSFAGTVVATTSVIFASASQILCGSLQAKYDVSPSMLLAIVSPYKAALLFAIGPLMDRTFFSNSALTDYTWTRVGVQLFSTSCVLAIVVNLAQYTAIRLLGSGIYAALGQAKTSALVVIGSIAFHGRATPAQLAGTGVAISAVWCLLWLEWDSTTEEDITSLQKVESKPQATA
jgi:solute carrier family 35 protein E3